MLGYVQNRDLFVSDLAVGADSVYRLPVRVIFELAWSNLFATNIFLAPLDNPKNVMSFASNNLSAS